MNNIKLYTIEEVSDILKVTPRTIYTFIKKNDLQAVKIGKYWRIRHHDLEQFVERGTES